MTKRTINEMSLMPLYLPQEEPTAHRAAAKKAGGEAIIKDGRRPSLMPIVNNLRNLLDDWRNNFYPGASDTTRELFYHWFLTDHLMQKANGDLYQFGYYFCQREAIETYVYLMEVAQTRTLSGLLGEYGDEQMAMAAEGIQPEEDLWPRYAFRMATGSGKTKVMSLAIVWSYFHALRESDSPMSRNFLVVAPNLTVFERLKEDFAYGKIFDQDPLIPESWRGDWNLTTVLQDEASGAPTGGTLYLTNIHRLYDKRTRRSAATESYAWAGPAVSKAKALDLSEELRKRVSSHRDLMVINDEAHHLWDPDSAWNDVIFGLDESYKSNNGKGLTAQLDFSATPKDQGGNFFKHIVVDSPLGEAVDAGIVKVPIIGHVPNLQTRADENAAWRYDEHLRLGYNRWQKSWDEWKESGQKALLFIMCENTKAADEITQRLNTDPVFEMLNGKTINLHTNLKGKLKRIKGSKDQYEFVENENDISDEDLNALRKLSRELDNNTSPYRCIVSVLMLREGWDVRNVTTIVPLRPYSAKAQILPEQTLGRGLRRITPPGQALETVTVVEHPSFVRLYTDELEQEGLFIENVAVDAVASTTMSIFPDDKKDWTQLGIQLPGLSDSFRIVPRIEDITIEDILEQSKHFPKLTLGEARQVELDFQGRSLITNEIVEQMKISLPLLESGIGAITFYREELERICKVSGTHATLAPLIEKYLTEVLFVERVTLYDNRLVARLGDADVREHVRAVFVPVINRNILVEEERVASGQGVSLSEWKPYQVSATQERPVIPAQKTLFNLVPCNRNLERVFAEFADQGADDVIAFAKNAGPQALRIDYEGSNSRHAYYTPDFFVRLKSGKHFLVETKGAVEKETAKKAKAAIAWCTSASRKGEKWEYLYIPEAIFQRFNENSMEALARACSPELQNLVKEAETQQPSFAFYEVSEEEKTSQRERFIKDDTFELLPEYYQEMINEAGNLFAFLEQKGQSFAACFTPLLGPIDHACKSLIIGHLEGSVPRGKQEQSTYFRPDYGGLSEHDIKNLERNGGALKKALAYNSFGMPIGILSFCLEYARRPMGVGGVFATIEKQFSQYNNSQLFERIEQIRAIRNNYVAHQTKGIFDDAEKAKVELKNWISGLAALHRHFLQIGY